MCKVGKQQVKKNRFAEALFNRNKTCINRAQRFCPGLKNVFCLVHNRSAKCAPLLMKRTY